MDLRKLAINFGEDDRLLDHLAPLCEAFSMPLLVTAEKNLELLSIFYPKVKAHFHLPSEINYQKLLEEYDLFFQSTFWKKNDLLPLFAQDVKDKRFVYLPHGNSDKGFEAPLMRQIKEQEISFLYGKHMQERLQKQGLLPAEDRYLFCGNYRLLYYRENQSYLDSLADEKIFSHLSKNNKTILYAPTWQDEEKGSSFFTLTRSLIEKLPSDCNLLIKVHPLLMEHDPARTYALLYQNTKKNLFVIEDFPPIYPILSKVDGYIGDFSSIGYDALTFPLKLFFFDPQKRDLSHPSRYLHRCGYSFDIDQIELLYNKLSSKEEFPDRGTRRTIYKYAFGEEKRWEDIYSSLLSLVYGRKDK